MTDKELVLDTMRKYGRTAAQAVQAKAPEMTGTELIAEEGYIPDFDPARDYSDWKPGWPVRDEGQVWPLIQPHNAAHYEGRPSTLRALWGLAHTTDPKQAKEYVAPYGTSGLWMMDECCTEAGRVYRSRVNDGAYAPSEYPGNWEDLGTVEEVAG